VEEFANKFMSLNVGPKILSGWWFGTMEFYDFPYIGNVIIPTDELIFFRGLGQPPASNG